MSAYDFDNFIDFARAVGDDVKDIQNVLQGFSGEEPPPLPESENDTLKALIYAGL